MIGMSKLLHTNDSPLQLLNLDKIAQSVSFIQRKTQGFSAFGFIIALIKCCAKGEGSFYHISLELGYLEQKIISRVAVYKRITTKATLFLRTTINELIHQSARSIYEVSTKHSFLRVLIEDSTFQRMCFGNAANFPAHGNGKSRTAGFKIDLAYDLLTGLPISQIFTYGTHQDKELGKALLGLVKAGDLVLRDMGYFVIESFQIIASKGAFWLTRLLMDGSRGTERWHGQMRRGRSGKVPCQKDSASRLPTFTFTTRAVPCRPYIWLAVLRVLSAA
jgi:hypothetical protein